jgi:hypothetical protein
VDKKVIGERFEWTFTVNRTEENRANACKALDGKPLFSVLYGMYAVKLTELRAVLKVSAEAGQSGAVNITSVESMAQDNYQEVKRCKRHISNNTSQAAKKSTKPVPTTTAFKLPPRAVLTHNFFALL